jgi:NDP-sugar pyrophosphorylase family protein
MAQFHTEQEALITVAVKPRTTKETYSNVFIQGNTIVDFQKSQSHQLVGIVNTGVYIFETEALKYIPNQKVAMLETDVFPKITKLGTLIAFPFQGIWFDITSDKNYQQGLKSMKK